MISCESYQQIEAPEDVESAKVFEEAVKELMLEYGMSRDRAEAKVRELLNYYDDDEEE